MPLLGHTLGFLDLAFQETPRMNAPVGMLAREAVKDTAIDGHFVPAGTKLMLAIHPTQRMEPWWKDPDRFDPERFSPERRDDGRHLNGCRAERGACAAGGSMAAVSTAPYSALVARHGLSPAHALLLAAVPDGSRVLDVGCASGYLGEILQQRGCTLIGIEADTDAAGDAPFPVLTGDLGDPAVRAEVGGPFDTILCGDVLEHLADPAETLAWLATLLTPDGTVVVSVPNIAHWTGRRALIRGRFPQEDHGLFDRTHLRWFTRASARALVEGAGLRVVAEDFTPAPLPLQAHLPALARFEARALRARPELFALQIVLTARGS